MLTILIASSIVSAGTLCLRLETRPCQNVCTPDELSDHMTVYALITTRVGLIIEIAVHCSELYTNVISLPTSPAQRRLHHVSVSD